MRLKQRFSRLAPVTLLVVGALIAGCSQAVTPAPEPEAYQPTPIPDDITELYRAFGNDEADTVWIYEQGGPAHEFDPAYGFFAHYFEPADVHFIQVHQTLTLNHRLAEREVDWMLPELQAEVDVSVEILHRTIEHFKEQGKRVVVVGHSYGAFLVTRYLAIEGPEAADRYLIMAGRLDMPKEVVKGFLRGEPYLFPNAVTPVQVEGMQFTPRELMEMRIAGATGDDRYTSELADTDLAQVIYVYGTHDRRVGRLTEAEVEFLKSKGSMVLPVHSPTLEDDHASMLMDSDVIREIVAALNE
ncbi:MAG: alpha/beta fold hydrolase [Spirochaetaceae bacterium]|nr:alpha/beta fold hydrolase [Spirochaetaceae bacterium]